MIHSLSGGVIADNQICTFVKVEIEGAPYWYLSEEKVKEGDLVLAPFGKSERIVQGKVLKVEVCSSQCAPMPMKSMREIECVL